MTTDVAVKSLLVDMLYTVLTDVLISNVPEDDETRVGLLTLGRYTGSPTAIAGGINVEIHGNHLLGPTKTEAGKDTQGDRDHSASWQLPSETIHGSILRWIRGVVIINYHLKPLNRENADVIVETIAARIRGAISDDSRLIGIEDSFGEVVHVVNVTDSYSYTNEGHTPATGRHLVEWRAMVSRPKGR